MNGDLACPSPQPSPRERGEGAPEKSPAFPPLPLAGEGRGEGVCAQSSPAPRAHWYFAPSTATGISVEYAYAGMPCSYKYCAASSTCTSPASDTTIGFSMPLARISSRASTMIFAKVIGGGVMVGPQPRSSASVGSFDRPSSTPFLFSSRGAPSPAATALSRPPDVRV